MMWCKSFLCSSIGKKVLMALTGISLCGFLLVHLAGNFLLLAGPDAFNAYSHKLTSMPVIYVAEGLLLLLFFAHLYLSITLTSENMAARPVGYAIVKNQGGLSRRTLASKSMIVTGSVVALFVIIHVKMLKFGEWIAYGTTEMRDMYALVLQSFSNPLIAGAYAIAVALLAVHLLHAFRSAFQTLGINNSKYNALIEKTALAFTLLVGAGFAFFPLWFLLQALQKGN